MPTLKYSPAETLFHFSESAPPTAHKVLAGTEASQPVWPRELPPMPHRVPSARNAKPWFAPISTAFHAPAATCRGLPLRPPWRPALLSIDFQSPHRLRLPSAAIPKLTASPAATSNQRLASMGIGAETDSHRST